jgi:predicted nucleic acid-binding protein
MTTPKGGPIAELRAAIKSLDTMAEKLLHAKPSEQSKLLSAVRERFAEAERILSVIEKAARTKCG